MHSIDLINRKTSNRFLLYVFIGIIGNSRLYADVTADFAGDPTSGYATLTVEFTDQSTGSISSWTWEFPGGWPASATGQGPHQVTYHTQGTYNVSLTVIGTSVAQQDVDTETKTHYIDVWPPRLDFGDAPYNLPENHSYPTVLALNGARHRLDFFIHLGDLIDNEDDGYPSPFATGDDLVDDDDEDGVTIPELLVDLLCEIEVIAAGTGHFFGWIDFNRDGDWDEPNEQIFNNMGLSPGISTLSFTVPSDADTGYTFARFRYSTERFLDVTGEAEDGEVEDYRVHISFPYLDFGDAPFDLNAGWLYLTVLAHNGARHILNDEVFMGDDLDGEMEAYVNSDATGDDTDSNGDDEDGITVGELKIGITNTIQAKLYGSGYFNGWIDFNRNSSWTDTEDHIIQNLSFSTGSYDLTFTVPAGVDTGITFARFRYSTDPNLGSIGLAPDGEVEDYQVHLSHLFQDYGDAPFDPIENVGYPTLHANNGARHTISDQLYLGDKVDGDANGQPDSDAQGDDEDDQGDDEDGITIGDICIGHPNTIQVKVHGTGYLTGWIDFNRNNSWEDEGNLILNQIPISTGTHNLAFNVSSDLDTGISYARFRLSSQPVVSSMGLAADGEVEDYLVNIIHVELDYGDAPWNTTYPDYSTLCMYPTYLADNGPRHAISPVVFLGDTVDGENEAYMTVYSDGDDDHDLDDEDGIRFPTHLIGGDTVYFRVSVRGNGYLNGWLDFNWDGDFNDPDDHIFDDIMLSDGIYMLPVYCDPGYTTIIANSRFRYSSDPDLTYEGYASNGEVEDYTTGLMGWWYPSQFDFGDLPDDGTVNSYPTYGANYGASHRCWNYNTHRVFLGDTVDTDPDGQPNSDATGDDLDGIDDDDGVIIPDLIAGETATIQVIATGTGYLSAWIDFKQDFGWDLNNPKAVEDRIFDSVLLTTGTHSLTFSVPDDAVPGFTYARFRYNHLSGSCNPTWDYISGEVEDYKVNIIDILPTHMEGNRTSSEIKIPESFKLSQNYPNPFNPATTIQYQLPHDAEATISIYDIQGREVIRLVEHHKNAGYHGVTWDGCDKTGRIMPSGIYIYQISVKSDSRQYHQIKKMTFVR
ncbi:T9SS type A sorting domain-containing protein [bacterium]|nr:T9SS type A sorting domain-containing protein [bacterium]